MLAAHDHEVLAQSQLMQRVDLAAIEPELAQCERLIVPPGAVLLDPLQRNERVYVLLSGELLVCLQPSPDHPIVRIQPGACAGELSIIDDEPPSAYVVSSVRCELLAIHKQVVFAMMGKAQQIAVNLLTILAERIRQNNAVLLNTLEMQRHYRNRAELDGLTGLHNRYWMNEIFPRQLELSERIGQSVTLMMLDLDRFKVVNDSFGHPVGDLALQFIGSVIRQNTRSTDLAARYGGEEFLVMMPATDIAQARLSAERLRQRVAASPLILADGRMVPLTISIGLAEWHPGERLDQTLRAVDHALLEAKNTGRDRVALAPNPFQRYP